MNRNYRPFISLSHLLTSLLLLVTGVLPAQKITTIAGGSIGDGKPANTIGFSNISCIQPDSAENLYLLDNDNFRLRKVSATTGIISTIPGGILSNGGIAGANTFTVDRSGNIYIVSIARIHKIDPATGIIIKVAGAGLGYSGDGGFAVNAGVSNPYAITTDTLGNIYFADSYRIRKITVATGIINTIAGTGTSGYSGDGGPASLAQVSTVTSLTTDQDGNVYMTDNTNNVIRKITAATGIITTAVGTGTQGAGGDGGPANLAQLANAKSVVADKTGNLYVLDNQKIRKVDAVTGIIYTIAGNGTSGYTADGNSAYNAYFNNPGLLTISRSGNLYINDRDHFVIRKITAGAGILSTVCGNRTKGTSGIGGPVADAQLYRPQDFVTDRFNNIYLLDFFNYKVYRIDARSKMITTVAGTGQQGVYEPGGKPATATNIGWSFGLAVDAQGNFYFAEYGHLIRKVDVATGILTTFAGIPGNYGYSGDGGPATAATFYDIYGMTFDQAGNMYIAEKGNHTIRKISATTGIVTTVAGTGVAGYAGDNGPAAEAKLNSPYSVAVDRSGNLFISDHINYVIRRVDAKTNIITTVAGTGAGGFSGDGGAATAATMSYPYGITTDTAGNVFIADQFNLRVRKLTVATGIITTVAGNGIQQNSGDSIVAISASLNMPTGVCFDTSGHLLINDSYSNRIRKLYDTVPKVITDVPSLNTPNAIATKIFPNPANGQVNVSLQGNIHGNITVTVTDMLGKTILTRRHAIPSTDNYTTPLLLPQLQSGLYFVTVYVNTLKLVNKLIVQ